MASIGGNSSSRNGPCVGIPGVFASCLTLGQESEAVKDAKWNAKETCEEQGKELGDFEIQGSPELKNDGEKYWTSVKARYFCKAPEKR